MSVGGLFERLRLTCFEGAMGEGRMGDEVTGRMRNFCFDTNFLLNLVVND